MKNNGFSWFLTAPTVGRITEARARGRNLPTGTAPRVHTWTHTRPPAPRVQRRESTDKAIEFYLRTPITDWQRAVRVRAGVRTLMRRTLALYVRTCVGRPSPAAGRACPPLGGHVLLGEGMPSAGRACPPRGGRALRWEGMPSSGRACPPLGGHALRHGDAASAEGPQSPTCRAPQSARGRTEPHRAPADRRRAG